MTIGITGPERKVPRQSAVVGFIIAAVFVGICLILLWLASDFLVDWLWFSSIGYPQVFWTTIGAKAVVLFAVWTGTAVVLWLNGWLAVRFARRQPTQSVAAFVWNLAGNVPPPDLLALMRDRLPWPRVIAGGAGLLALLVAAAEVGNWGVILQFFYHVPYGADDPLFNKDISFYLFVLPAYILIKNWMLLTLVLSALFAAAIYWVHGDIEYDIHHRSMSPTAIAHGSALLALLFVVKAWSYVLDRYLLLYGDNGVVVGASYTDVHVGLPGLWLMIGLSIIAAFAALANLRVRTYRLPAAAVMLVVIGSFVLSGVAPRAVPAVLRQTKRVGAGEALHRTQHRAHPAGIQSRSDRSQAVCRRTEAYLQDARRQQGDNREYQAVGLACPCRTPTRSCRRSAPTTNSIILTLIATGSMAPTKA